MDAIKGVTHTGAQPITVFLRTSIVLLALTTAAIHASLGGLFFTSMPRVTQPLPWR